MKHLIATAIFSALGFSMMAQTQMDCVVNSVNAAASTLTLQRGSQAGIFKVAPTAVITLNGTKAGLKDIKARTRAKVTTINSDTVVKLDAVASAPHATATSTPPPSIPKLTTKEKITIAAKDNDGFRINDVPRNTIFYFRYASGKWKHHGNVAEFEPDDAKTPEQSKLVVSLPRTGNEMGAVLVVVPAGTKKRAFMFKADKDYPALVLRINSAPSSNPGKVEYEVTIVPPPR